MAYDTNTNPSDFTDEVIRHELQQQALWRKRQKEWDSSMERARLSRRHSYLTIISNIASVAALLIVGMVLQNLAASFKSSRIEVSIAPAITHQVEYSDTIQSQDN